MRKKNKKCKQVAGFTLIELMAAMMIIAFLAGVAGIAIVPRIKRARHNTAVAQISSFEQAVAAFHLDCGFYPPDLSALIKAPSGRACRGYTPGGYLSKPDVPKDPWENPYQYISPGSHNTDGYDMWSYGADGQDGSDDDVTNWKSEDQGGDAGGQANP